MKQKRGYSLMKDSHIKAVHDDDLEGLLSSLGYYEKVRDGECQCHFCSQTISMNNLGAILPLNGKISFLCDSVNCLQKMIEVGNDNVY